MLYVAAGTFGVMPKAGSETDSLVRAEVGAVFGPLKTTVVLIRDDRTTVCLITTHFMIERYAFSNWMRRCAAEELEISPEQVFVFSSHNHNQASLVKGRSPHGMPLPDAMASESELTREGRMLLRGIRSAARRIRKKTVPVRVAWNVGHERRVTYNRKGRRADGSTYLMREEDRALLGKDFNGDIEDDAPVVAFLKADGRPVCFLTHFTGHPATNYHPEYPVVHGDFPQFACDDLSEAFGGVPVGFLQGCAGDSNSKGLLLPKPVDEKVHDAIRYGHYLGGTYIRAAKRLRDSATEGLAFARERVQLPFQKVPSANELRRQVTEMDEFIRRCEAGDETAICCAGINTARAMSPRYRAALIEPCRRWAEWALDFHRKNRLASAPKHVDVDVGAIRIGDVGVFGMPCEPLMGIGRQIKRDAELPLVLPCGYMEDQTIAYVPDGPNNGDSDFMSAYYRYTTALLPYKDPAGDLLAQAATRMLHNLRDMPNHE